MKTKSLLGEYFEFFVILILIAVRVFVNSEKQEWINIVNYIGLLTALWALYIRLHSVFRGKKQVNFITGLFALIACLALLFGALYFTGVIPFSPKTNDIILLLTLLVSLPMQLYEHFFISILK